MSCAKNKNVVMEPKNNKHRSQPATTPLAAVRSDQANGVFTGIDFLSLLHVQKAVKKKEGTLVA